MGAMDIARKVLETEAEAIRRLLETIDGDFERAVDLILATAGRVVWTGMGKSGIICRKLAATMSSTGTPALFLHPAEAIHGDLGMVTEGDLVIAVSNSGATEEILALVALLKRLGVGLIAMSSRPDSPLAEASDCHLDLGVRKEACPLGLAPTASTQRAWLWVTPCVWRSPKARAFKRKISPDYIPVASWARSSCESGS